MPEPLEWPAGAVYRILFRQWDGWDIGERALAFSARKAAFVIAVRQRVSADDKQVIRGRDGLMARPGR
jgi:hypothetical protein